MKNLIPSVSALTIGAASLAVTTALQASEGGAKPWTVRAGVSGFYNDNVYTRSDLAKVDSFGFELTPGFSLNLPVNDGQTTLGLRYDYLLRYFENRAKAVDHALAIVGELAAAVDHDAAPELGDNLTRLWDFVGTQLSLATVNNDAAPLAEVEHIVETLRTSFAEAGQLR